MRNMLRFELSGKAGETLNVQIAPESMFKGDKLVATDTSRLPGYGTELVEAHVGNLPQFYMINDDCGIPTIALHEDAEDNLIGWDLCGPKMYITLKIKFLEDCTWTGELHGELETAKNDVSLHEAASGLRDATDKLKRVKKTALAFPCQGEAGKEYDIETSPYMLFAGKKLIALDTIGNESTEIIGMFVNGSKQTPKLRIKVPTSSYAYNKKNNSMEFKTCAPTENITLVIRFKETCTWKGVLFGDAAY
jgi:hypothetical protein